MRESRRPPSLYEIGVAHAAPIFCACLFLFDILLVPVLGNCEEKRADAWWFRENSVILQMEIIKRVLLWVRWILLQ